MLPVQVRAMSIASKAQELNLAEGEYLDSDVHSAFR